MDRGSYKISLMHLFPQRNTKYVIYRPPRFNSYFKITELSYANDYYIDTGRKCWISFPRFVSPSQVRLDMANKGAVELVIMGALYTNPGPMHGTTSVLTCPTSHFQQSYILYTSLDWLSRLWYLLSGCWPKFTNGYIFVAMLPMY